MSVTAYGTIATGSQIEKAVTAVLKLWFPSYLREVERQVEWEGKKLPTPRSYSRRNAIEMQPGEAIPKCIVSTPGLWEQPMTKESDGYYQATWQLGVGIITADKFEEIAKEKADIYCAAARAIMEQQLTSEIQNVWYVSWLDESYDDVPSLTDQIAQLRFAGGTYGVGIDKATAMFTRPPEISEAPAIYGEVQDTITTVTIKED